MLSFAEVLNQLHTPGLMADRAPTLERMHAVLDKLEALPRIDPDRVIIVAGTNGKGSVARALESILQAGGFRVGLFTSPHIRCITERIRINGADVSESHFCRLYDAVSERTQDMSLSHFEMLTSMAVYQFFLDSAESKSAVDYAIFEVGMGGLLDPTNSIPHQHCVITSLSLDHTRFLGKDLPSIARHKFGVVREGCVVFHRKFEDSSVAALARATAIQTGSEWHEVSPHRFRVELEGAVPRWSIFLDEEWIQLPLPGERAVENLSLAIAQARALGVRSEAISKGIRSLYWPCRMEQIDWIGKKDDLIFFSGDHNPDGFRSLVEILSHFPPHIKLQLMIGLGSGKDTNAIWDELQNIEQRFELHLTKSPFRGAAPEDLGILAQNASSLDADPLRLLLGLVRSLRTNEVLVVTGSLYLVGFLSSQAEELKKLSQNSPVGK